MSYDVVKHEFSLLSQIKCSEVLWNSGDIVSWAGAASRFESEVLEGDEPWQGQEVDDNNIWPHHIKHAFLALQIEHKDWHEQHNHTTVRQKVKLLGDVFRAI